MTQNDSKFEIWHRTRIFLFSLFLWSFEFKRKLETEIYIFTLYADLVNFEASFFFAVIFWIKVTVVFKHLDFPFLLGINGIPQRFDLWTFTRFVDGFSGKEKSTNRRTDCIVFEYGSRVILSNPKCDSENYTQEIIIEISTSLPISIKFHLFCENTQKSRVLISRISTIFSSKIQFCLSGLLDKA